MLSLILTFILPFAEASGNTGALILEKMMQQLGTPTQTELSPGQKKIAEMKRRNRELLMVKKEETPKNFLEKQADKIQKTHQKWSEKQNQIIDQWLHRREEFFKNIEQYKSSSFDLASEVELKNMKLLQKKLSQKTKHESFIVSSALDRSVRDQKQRPTCAAFAGIRVLELMFSSPKDLSEQYFYYLSKPNCRPCSKRGSWVVEGFQRASQKPIPNEDQCPYEFSNKESNQTQTPLPSSCFQGNVTTVGIERINTLDELLSFIETNRAAVGAFKLTDHFYQTKGIVKASEDTETISDHHTKAHALAIVGYINLPTDLNEGRVCFVVTNSWSEGWGIGGHACLTEKWIHQNRIPTPFIGLKSLN